MRHLILAFTLLVVPVLAQAPRLAPPPPMGQFHPEEGRTDGLEFLRRMADDLDLAPDQRDEIRGIIKRYAPAMRTERELSRASMEAFHQAMEKPNSSPALLQNLHQIAAQDQFQVLLTLRTLKTEVLAVLTPEQEARFKQMRPFQNGMRPSHPPMGGFQSPSFSPDEDFE